jgi:histidine triad (HIT) family protein
MDSDCIFCKIIAGDLPCTKIYEDDDVLAFLDVGPIIKGHTLVIPKQHVDPLTELSDELLGKLMVVVKRVTRAQLDGLGADGVNITQANGKAAGQIVPHVHMHVIPRFDTDGHHWNWNAKCYDSPDEMTALGQKLSTALNA